MRLPRSASPCSTTIFVSDGDRLLEHVALGDEVGLAVQLDERADVALDQHLDAALVGVATGALGRARDALLAQPVLGALDVALGLVRAPSCNPSSRRR